MTPTVVENTSFLKRSIVGLKSAFACGAIFEILKNPKKAIEKMALKSLGSKVREQEEVIFSKVLMSKIPLGVGVELFLKLLSNRKTE